MSSTYIHTAKKTPKSQASKYTPILLINDLTVLFLNTEIKKLR